MVRINEFGEIVRDESPPTNRPQPPTRTNASGPVQRMVVLGAIAFGLLGGLAGYGAGARWCRTEVPETGKWSKSFASIPYSVHVASWSRHPVHHALQDVTMPLRLLLVLASGVGILIAVYSDGGPAGEGEGCGVLLFLLVGILLVTTLIGAVFRLLVYLLAYPVTWFANDLSGPWSGMLTVGLCWAAIGAILGLIAGGIMAINER